MLFLLTDSPQNLKLERVHGTLILLFYVSLSSSQLQFREENAKILSKNSTTQENITISRQNLLFSIKNTKKASDWWKENARLFSKNSTTQRNI